METTMRYRTFGKMGWKVSEISFGAWAIGGNWVERKLRAHYWRRSFWYTGK